MANATKLYDLVVKVGEYQKNGQTKSRYKNIGAVFRNENGQYMMLDKTFNPAGVPGNADRDNILVSMFEPRAQGGGQGNQQSGGYDQSGYGSGGRPGGGIDLDGDSVPFAACKLI